MNNHFDTIIIGGGPAGLTAGIYLSRAKTKALILNEGVAGGQMVMTHEVANYPGIENISGYMLARTMQKQAESFGCVIKSNIKISKINLTDKVKSFELSNGQVYTSDSVILATGGKPRPLDVPGEKKFIGRGISYCATCDGDFFQDKKIIVVGGGNSALEEAVSLTQYASKVTIVHQFDHFQGYKHAIEEAEKNEKIDFLLESVITEFKGEQNLEKIAIKNLKTGELSEKNIEGTFIFIGYIPQTDFVKDIVELNQWGEILTDEKLQTNIPGVFAAGDSREKKIRQITTAVSDGTVSALNAIEFLAG